MPESGGAPQEWPAYHSANALANKAPKRQLPQKCLLLAIMCMMKTALPPAGPVRPAMQSLLVLCWLALLDGAPTHCVERFEFEEPHLGTRCRLVFYAPDQGAADSAARAAFERIHALEDIMSDYQPQSELMRLCAAAGGLPVRASSDLFAVL